MAKRTPPVRAKAETRTRYGTPRRMSAEGLTASRDPVATARRAIQALAPKLGIAPDLSGLSFDQARPSLLGTHVTFQQVHDGNPVTGAWIRVDLDPQGRVFNI